MEEIRSGRSCLIRWARGIKETNGEADGRRHGAARTEKLRNNRKYLIPYSLIALLVVPIFENTPLGEVFAILFICGLGSFSMIDLKETFQKLSQKARGRNKPEDGAD
jgi:hypothetical protein